MNESLISFYPFKSKTLSPTLPKYVTAVAAASVADGADGGTVFQGCNSARRRARAHTNNIIHK